MNGPHPVGAVVVAGGAARRFGGLDKLRVEVDGVAVLARVLAAVRAVEPDEIVVVGPRRPGIDDGCLVVREEPVGAGPAAALAAGLAALNPPVAGSAGAVMGDAAGSAGAVMGTEERVAAVVLVVAGDLPHLTGAALRFLLDRLAAEPDADAVMARDATARRQHLLAAWHSDALSEALAELGDPVGRPVAALGDGRRVALVDLPCVPGEAPPWQDLDVPPGSVSGGGS